MLVALMIVISPFFILYYRLAYYRSLRELYNKLKEIDTESWNNLGQPDIRGDKSPHQSDLIAGYLYSKKYKELNNDELTKIGDRVVTSSRISDFFILLFILTAVVSQYL